MSYDNDFYAHYLKYLDEPTVRKNHNRVFRIFEGIATPHLFRVLDLGCGTGEFRRHGRGVVNYLGIDTEDSGLTSPFLQADYKNLTQISSVLTFPPNIFVSLFSAECCLDLTDRYAFYRNVFEQFSSIKFGLVSGFYYKSKADKETVEEAGGIVSYQTIEQQVNIQTDEFSELRLVMDTPSKMFGADVVEVWKIFLRYPGIIWPIHVTD